MPFTFVAELPLYITKSGLCHRQRQAITLQHPGYIQAFHTHHSIRVDHLWRCLVLVIQTAVSYAPVQPGRFHSIAALAHG